MKKLKKKFKFSSQKWLNRNNKDKYIKLSKESGYRSRAYFKLQEVNQKFHIIRNNIKIETHLIENCDHQIPIEASSIALEYIKKNLMFTKY